MIELFIQKALEAIANGGYPAVFLLSFIDRAAMNLAPAEIILPFFGFLIQQGRFAFWPVMLVVTVGGLIGDIVLYWLSLKGGRWFLEKYGRYIFVSHHELDHTDRLFAKHGGKLVLFGRILPPVRTFIAIPAGVSRMNFGKFVLYTAIGSLPWSFVLIYFGLKAGENWQKFLPYFKRIDLVAMIGLAAVLTWYVYRHFRRRHLTH